MSQGTDSECSMRSSQRDIPMPNLHIDSTTGQLEQTIDEGQLANQKRSTLSKCRTVLPSLISFLILVLVLDYGVHSSFSITDFQDGARFLATYGGSYSGGYSGSSYSSYSGSYSSYSSYSGGYGGYYYSGYTYSAYYGGGFYNSKSIRYYYGGSYQNTYSKSIYAISYLTRAYSGFTPDRVTLATPDLQPYDVMLNLTNEGLSAYNGTDYEDLLYLRMYVGSKNQPMNFLLDLNSPWTHVPVINNSCTSQISTYFINQTGNLFFQECSMTYINDKYDWKPQLSYAEPKTGYIAQDKLGFKYNEMLFSVYQTFQASNKTSFYPSYNSSQATVYHQNDTQYFDKFQQELKSKGSKDKLMNLNSSFGVLGLSINNETGQEKSHYTSRLTNYTTIYFEYFTFNYTNGTLSLLLGGYDKDYVEDVGINWIDQYEDSDQQWQTQLNHLELRLDDKSSTIQPTPLKVTYDVNSPFILMPEADYAEVQNFFTEEVSGCEIDDEEFIICSCSAADFVDDSTKFPMLVFSLGDGLDLFYLHMYGRQYLKDQNGTCKVMIYQQPEKDFWLLGLPFIKSFSITFNRDDKKIGFSGDITAQIRAWQLALILVAAILVFIGLVICFICLCMSTLRKMRKASFKRERDEVIVAKVDNGYQQAYNMPAPPKDNIHSVQNAMQEEKNNKIYEGQVEEQEDEAPSGPKMP